MTGTAMEVTLIPPGPLGATGRAQSDPTPVRGALAGVVTVSGGGGGSAGRATVVVEARLPGGPWAELSRREVRPAPGADARIAFAAHPPFAACRVRVESAGQYPPPFAGAVAVVIPD
jgi:hypothetical protein